LMERFSGKHDPPNTQLRGADVLAASLHKQIWRQVAMSGRPAGVPVK
jgi:hypothetical protein